MLLRLDDQYRQKASFRDMSMFEVLRAPTMFIKGRGTVRATFNMLEVELAEPFEEVVLCYNWIDGMRAPAPVELFPFDAGRGVTLLGVRPRGQTRFRLTYRGRL
jgi:hypothetical protein